VQAPPIKPGGDPGFIGTREPDSLPELRSPRRIRWMRRRRAASSFWAQYRKSKMGMFGLFVLIAFTAMAIFAVFADASGVDPSQTSGPVLAPPSREYPLGTDDFGLSVLTLVIQGSKISLLVGLTASVLSMTIGASIGIIAGYRGGRVDTFLMRITDVGLVIPWLALAIVLASVIGQSLLAIILVIGLTSWPSTARLVRAQVLSIRERPYIERARALGSSNRHMIARHVLPNDAGATTLGAWWWIGAPGVCITLVVLAFTMCGFAMDEIINPKLRDR
jgi:peptide/nickel transport system permease protein